MSFFDCLLKIILLSFFHKSILTAKILEKLKKNMTIFIALKHT